MAKEKGEVIASYITSWGLKTYKQNSEPQKFVWWSQWGQEQDAPCIWMT